MAAVPSRDVFMTSCKMDAEKCGEVRDMTDKIRVPLWELYNSMGLEKLE